MKNKIITLLLLVITGFSIFFAMFIYIHHNNKYNTVSSPPYVFSDFQYGNGSDTLSVQDEIMATVKSPEFEEADAESRARILADLISEISIHGTKTHQYPLIDPDSIYTEGNSVWAIYLSPDDFFSRWEIEDTRIIQYSYADRDSWERRESTEHIYFIYHLQ